MAYDSVSSQSQMALDKNRNKHYFEALKRVVTPDSVVLDLGAGLGVLGLFAAKLGAKHVYLVEPEPVIKVASQIANDNGLSDRVTCLQSKIEDAELPEKVDIIISVFTGNFLLGENLLPLLFATRDRYLKPGGVLLPGFGDMWIAPVRAKKFYERRVDRFEEPHYGLNVDSIRKYIVNSPHRARFFTPEDCIAEPQKIRHVDFYQSDAAFCKEAADFLIDKPAVCDGFLGWFTIDLDGQTLSNAPGTKKLHWSPLLFLCETPIELAANESLTISVVKTEQSAWNWQFQTIDQTQRLSQLHTQITLFGFGS